jgi:hypothetical protein
MQRRGRLDYWLEDELDRQDTGDTKSTYHTGV